MGLYRKKPVAVEARQLTVFNLDELEEWCGGHVIGFQQAAKYRTIAIPTLEGVMQAAIGDWIIKGVKGEFYPCKPDIFEATYEPA